MYYRTLNFLFLQFIKSEIDWEKKTKIFSIITSCKYLINCFKKKFTNRASTLFLCLSKFLLSQFLLAMNESPFHPSYMYLMSTVQLLLPFDQLLFLV